MISIQRSFKWGFDFILQNSRFPIISSSPTRTFLPFSSFSSSSSSSFSTLPSYSSSSSSSSSSSLSSSDWSSKYLNSSASDVDTPSIRAALASLSPDASRRVVIVGGGHNGLVASCYLAQAGFDVTVLERRDIVGGACITEELIPGFKFSRAAYLAGLLRPSVVEELNLHSHGFSYLPRDPSSFTPTPSRGGPSLLMGADAQQTLASIRALCPADAEAYPRYEALLSAARDIITPLLDAAPPQLHAEARWPELLHTAGTVLGASRAMLAHAALLPSLYELLTAPASLLLERHFKGDLLKATLATDAVIGANTAPSEPGSAYVLLHHVMGHCGDPSRAGVWSQVPGGMGTITRALASAAEQRGVRIVRRAPVAEILHEEDRADAQGKRHRVKGVKLADGSVIEAPTVLSATTPYHTFIELLRQSEDGRDGDGGEKGCFPEGFIQHIEKADYSGGAFKINCAVDALPSFLCLPNSPQRGGAALHHRGTIHFENSLQEIEDAHKQARNGIPAARPVIEMTIPSVVDPSLAPPGKHVVQLFVQYAPYDLDPRGGFSWRDQACVDRYADGIFKVVDEFAPGFSASVIGRDVLTPLHLERIFGLHKGNIQHGGIPLHQIAWARPVPGHSAYRTPMRGLYLCAAGAHPGGGVQGAPGRNCARIVISDLLQKFLII